MPGQHPHRAGRAVSGGHDDSGTAGSVLEDGGISWRARAGLFLATSALAGPLAGAVAHAEIAGAAVAGLSMSAVEVMQLAVFVGVTGTAFLSAIVLIRERARTSAENVELRSRLADINAALRRSEALINLRDQRVVVWAAENKKPELIGTLPVES
ncbi:MAG: alkaline phosphatase, partial [Mesorhizobium sp.]